MNSSVRAKRDERGFTMIELLVTIVIAAIFFAALIPFLVSAQTTTAGQNMRNIALQVARGKIEKIRQLDYDSVDPVYLNVNGPPTTPGGQFGTQWMAGTGGSQKQFDIKYDVVLMNADGTVCSTAGQEAYKVVKIYVKWRGAPLAPPVDPNAPPSDPRSKPAEYTFDNTPIILQTQVSRQYFGPQMVNLLSPDAVDNADPNNPVLTIAAGGNVSLIATVASQDLLQMTGSPLGQVSFTVTDMSGKTVASGSQSAQLSPSYPPGSTINGQYQWLWDSRTASTGMYIFTATATSGAGSAGNTWSVMYSVKADNLPAPTVTATPGDRNVSLSWGAVSSADYYRVYRSTASGQEALWADNVKVTSYLDSTPTLTNGTTYYYQVRAVDSTGKLGTLSLEVPCTPTPGPDSTPPTNPSNLTLTPGLATDTTLTFTWTASVDNPPPSSPSGVASYQIWSSSSVNGTYTQVGTVSGSPPLSPPATAFTNIRLTKNTTYYYKVLAVDGSNNASGFSAAAGFTTLATTPKGSQTVHNGSKGNTPMQVTMYNITTGLYYNNDSNGSSSTTAIWVTVNSTGQGNTTWPSLPVGSYQVTANSGSSPQQQQGPVSVASGSNLPVSFAF